MVCGRTTVFPLDRGGGLRGFELGADFDTERAVHDGDRRDFHILAHDDGAGAFVDDDFRGAVRVDIERFHFGDELDGARGVGRRHIDDQEAGAFGARDGHAGRANRLLIASTTRAAVVKSDWRSCSLKCDEGSMEGGVRSTIAPSGVRPTVG